MKFAASLLWCLLAMAPAAQATYQCTISSLAIAPLAGYPKQFLSESIESCFQKAKNALVEQESNPINYVSMVDVTVWDVSGTETVNTVRATFYSK